MSSTNEQNNNDNIKTAVDIFSEILVQIIDDMKVGNADASSKPNIKNLTKIKDIYDKTST